MKSLLPPWAQTLIPWIIYPTFLLSLIYFNNNILKRGIPIQLALEPFDPIDPLRGNYLRLNFQLPKFPNDQNFTKGQKVFLQLQEDSTGFYRFNAVRAKRPENEYYIISRVNWADSKEVYVAVPSNLNRYYINQDKALKADSLLNAHINQEEPGSASLQVRLKGGHSRIEEILIGKMPLLDFIND